VLSTLDLNGPDAEPNDARKVIACFQPSRPQGTFGPRTKARQLVFVGNGRNGIAIVDATDPSKPRVLSRLPGDGDRRAFQELAVRGLAFRSHFDLGSEGGRIPTVEHDYLYVVFEGRRRGEQDPQARLAVVRVTDPERPEGVGQVELPRGAQRLDVLAIYNPPFLQPYLVAATPEGGAIVDVSRSAQAALGGRLYSMTKPAYGQGEPQRIPWFDAAVEAFPLDRLVDETGAPEKDVSHEGARFLDRAELEKVLGAKLGGD